MTRIAMASFHVDNSWRIADVLRKRYLIVNLLTCKINTYALASVFIPYRILFEWIRYDNTGVSVDSESDP